MSWMYYFNLEPMVISIADENICKMTEDNLKNNEPMYLDEGKSLHNIKHGYIVVTMLVSFFESFVNSLIRLECGEYARHFLKKSIEEKIAILYMKKGLDNALYKRLHGDADYQRYKEVVIVRNELIHYKDSKKEHASFMPDFNIGRYRASVFFRQSEMIKRKEAIQSLTVKIARDMGYKVNPDVEVFCCDGVGDDFNYAYRPFVSDENLIQTNAINEDRSIE